MSETKEYNEEKQKLLIDVLLSSEEIFVRCQNILDSKYFVNKLRPAVRYIIDYSAKNSVLPKIQQVNAETGIEFILIDNITIQHQDAFLKEIEEFCKNRALAIAISESVDLISSGNYSEVERMVKDAVLISLQNDIGTDYFEDPKERLLRIKNNNGQISTGWKYVDSKLYGGINRGEITIFTAGSGVGKSLVKQNLAVNLIKQGLNVVYLSLELSEELCSMRIDSMITEVGTKEIFRKLDEIEIRVKQFEKKSGRLHIRQMPQGSTVNDIKAYLKNYEIKTQARPDAVIVDYLDLLFPNNKKIDPSNLYIKDKFVTEELRGLAVERKIFLVSSSQLNRTAVQEQEHDHSHIAGGISKIQTADNVISIFASAAMKERGQYQFQFLKTRSSSGVGSKINLGFDPETLRIFDLDEEMQQVEQKTAAEMFSCLKRTSKTIVKTPSTSVVPSNTSTASPEDQAKQLDSLRALIRR